MPAPSERATTQRRRILIVEDDAHVLPLLELCPLLTVKWSLDFAAASQALATLPWDAVISDYAIGGDGTEQRRAHSATAFGVMSALPQAVDSDDTPFLRKPLSPEELVTFLLRVLPA
jgi:DNA-binding response OmpR family regulator